MVMATFLFLASVCHAFAPRGLPPKVGLITPGKKQSKNWWISQAKCMENLKNGAEPEKGSELSQERVAEMVEVSFVNACLQLSQGYVDVLKLFIVAVQAAFNRHMSPSQLVEEVGSCSVQSAGRELMGEEVRLRTSWIHVVYLVLAYMNQDNAWAQSIAIDTAVRSRFADALPQLEKLRQAGGTFNAQEFQEKYATTLMPSSDDPTETAIVSQSLRVAWTTLTVLEEEQRCLEDGAGGPPRPPIPGTF